jgi:hypothetical protein
METITIKDRQVLAVSPEGLKAQMTIEDLILKLAPRRMDTNGAVLPDGLKAVFSRGPFTIWVHQTPPRIWHMKWIKADSPKEYGQGTTYRNVRIALPYIIVFAVFQGDGQLMHCNECFFRNEPLNDLSDMLLYPALLNCSEFHVKEGQALSWICTQHVQPAAVLKEPDLNKRMRQGLKTLLHCLCETGFNRSSEKHEKSSWFSNSVGVDPRIATVEKWQDASAKDPLFVLDVPWLKTDLSVQQLGDRIFKNRNAPPLSVATAADVARVVFNSQSK